MGTALRNPNHLFTMTCESGSVLEGAVLCAGSASDKSALPDAAGTNKVVLGLAFRDGSTSTGKPLEIVTSGVWPGIAGTTITVGDKLVVYDTNGKVGPIGLSTNPHAMIVGYALESASAGERVAMLIQPEQAANGVVLPFVIDTGSTITAGRAVSIGSADLTCAQPAGADPTSKALGVALTGGGAGDTIRVLVFGVTTVTASNATITAGDFLAIAANTGTVKTAGPAGGTNDDIIGRALQAFSANGTGLALINPHRIQG